MNKNEQYEKQSRFNRIKGCLYGVAIGDCLGAPVEFMTADDIRKCGMVTDIMDNQRLQVPAGFGTDDTAMTLAVAEGLIDAENSENPIECVGQKFVEWFNGDPIGLGGICGHAIAYASRGGRILKPTQEEWFTGAALAHRKLAGRSAGNGSLMRTAPIALLANAESIKYLAYGVSSMTHYDLKTGDACYYYCKIVAKLIQGKSLYAVMRNELTGTLYEGAEQMQPDPSGYVVDSFRTAIWGALNTDSFEEALEAVVNEGGDADTTGAICGGLVGAAYGFNAIPDRWVNALQKPLTNRLDKIIDVAARTWNC